MTESLAPSTIEELRAALLRCAEEQASIETRGAFSKRSFGGPIRQATYRLETSRLNRLLAYEPADLTVSVEAGMRYADLSQALAENNQFLPLDPPFAEDATVGGILAANSSGSRRRRFGTARDMTIGMRFATLDGKVVSSGGMVVKNVTGLDMAKLMIGSFGTLAVIASANFKVFPKPESFASFVFRATSTSLLEVRTQILAGVLQPIAIDWLDAGAAEAVGLGASPALLVEAAGSPAVTRRFNDAFGTLAATHGASLDGAPEGLWERVRECGPNWLNTHPDGALVRCSTVQARLAELLDLAGRSGCAAALRAGNATGLLLAPDAETAGRSIAELRQAGFSATLEAGPDSLKQSVEQWNAGGSELQLMQRIKADFDPLSLLNRSRLYDVI
ncbi:MAG: FAD-binding oxidoreductase [Bryobacterales bacterium]|nr:FAD-binding oxidoreductase [Bryobacterales bacterium]MDE0622872.1 FAD-binding oxidoreductase [Bryobacterales bacterium]